MDLPETFTAQITQEDIEKGERRCWQRCPVQRAAERALPAGVLVTAHRNGLSVRLGHAIAVYNHDAEQFMIDFDNGRSVSPRLVTFHRLRRSSCHALYRTRGSAPQSSRITGDAPADAQSRSPQTGE